MPIDSVEEGIEFVSKRPKPLSLYIFANDEPTQRLILDNTSAGGVTINGVIFHVTHPGLPFGGVGASGIGAYHGKRTFDAFCHHKSVLKKIRFGPTIAHDFPFIYPPWTEMKKKILKMAL